MPQDRLSNDEFFTRLSALLATRRDHGTVMLTQKRLSYTADSSSSNTTTSTTRKPTKPTPSRISKHPSKTPPKPIHRTKQPSPADLSDLEPPTTPLPILIRATNALSNDVRHKDAHIKLATVVESDDLEGFFGKYAEVCKTGFATLKKRDRKKAKSKAKGRRKKKRVEIEGAGGDVKS